MTVKELIKKLQIYPNAAEVIILTTNDEIESSTSLYPYTMTPVTTYVTQTVKALPEGTYTPVTGFDPDALIAFILVTQKLD